MTKIVLFASGSGTNAENIYRYFSTHPVLQVDSVWTNNPQAGVISRMTDLGCPTFVFDKESFRSGKVLADLQALQIDAIVLAGFLWLIPSDFVQAFPRRIINIHPALLPQYGGKGMYGSHVHQAVWEQGEKETGITVHYVNEHYDEGAIIHQARVALTSNDTPETIAQKVHVLEYEHFPRVIEELFGGHV